MKLESGNHKTTKAFILKGPSNSKIETFTQTKRNDQYPETSRIKTVRKGYIFIQYMYI